ncbi:MAG TPA: radical SAM protein [Fibrobacteria bacterium]|nr:radical SAM protein [Fibrobacteria bacterium]
MNPDRSREELFVVPGADGSRIIYAPLRRTAIEANPAAVDLAARIVAGESFTPTQAQRDALSAMERAGLFQEPYPPFPIPPADYVHRPHEVTLFTTTRCNLRCLYCYAEAGSRSLDMPLELAEAAIELVVRNSLEVGRKDFIVGFHGSGEPTTNWSLVQGATLHAKRRARETGLEAHVHCATNGLLSDTQIDFILEHFGGLNISFDGPDDIQDRQRPLAGGGRSSTGVKRTIQRLEEAGFPYGIRVTLTAAEAHRIQEIVDFVHATCPGLEQIHLEPVWQCGRCRTSGERPPVDEVFIDGFRRAWTKAKTEGYSLFYSGARIDTLTDRFCGASGDGFTVTPEGRVTSCFEVSDPADPRSALYHYGAWDPESGEFVFDPGKLRILAGLRVWNLAHCRDCFCKWHCAGDCLAKAIPGSDPASHRGSTRCRTNRELTRHQLQGLLSENGIPNPTNGTRSHVRNPE